MNYILFDSATARRKLLPFTFTRPVAEIRVGILTIADKWRKHLNSDVSYLTEEYLAKKYTVKFKEQNLYIAGNLCPDESVIKAIQHLKPNQKLVKEGVLLASLEGETEHKLIGESCEEVEFDREVTLITQNWHIFKQN
ncbi:Sugar-phosphate nucleotidyl transferase, partial [hydrothermal vent metagenome]